MLNCPTQAQNQLSGLSPHFLDKTHNEAISAEFHLVSNYFDMHYLENVRLRIFYFTAIV